jgi:hypothetical protein
LDVAITNAWIYYKLTNKELGDKDGSRADFYQSLAESLVNINIDGKDRYRECEKKKLIGTMAENYAVHPTVYQQKIAGQFL